MHYKYLIVGGGIDALRERWCAFVATKADPAAEDAPDAMGVRPEEERETPYSEDDAG